MKDIPAQDMTGTNIQTQAMETVMGNHQELVSMAGMCTAKIRSGETAMMRTTEQAIALKLFNATHYESRTLWTDRKSGLQIYSWFLDVLE